ncbi:MAG: hypothetical protein J3R72DRAFT_512044 [Linnemannia gamsii]|nr:MAG: hypothetical protein J3R72DRAFT_512044 [Linnemannia gamsii]
MLSSIMNTVPPGNPKFGLSSIIVEVSKLIQTQESHARAAVTDLMIEIGLLVPPTSEYVYVSAWIMLLNNMFNDSNLRNIPQQHKSVRLNGAIMLDLEQWGVDLRRCYPVIAEGQADNLLTLIAFKDHMRKFAIDVTNAPIMSPRNQVAPSGDRGVFVRYRTPPRRKRLNPFVIFSPSKKGKLNRGGAGGDHASNYDDDDDDADK